MATKSALMQAESELRRHALGYPEAIEELPWGHRAIKVNGRAFVFMGWSDEVFGLSVKLPVSARYALSLPFSTPTGYGLGKSGWVSARFNPHDEVPVDMLKEWVDESFRAIAPKGLLAQLPAAEYRPRRKAPARPKADPVSLRTEKPVAKPENSPVKPAAPAAKADRAEAKSDGAKNPPPRPAAKPTQPATRTAGPAEKPVKQTTAPPRPVAKPSQPTKKNASSSASAIGKPAQVMAKAASAGPKRIGASEKSAKPGAKSNSHAAKASRPASKPARPTAKASRPATKKARPAAKAPHKVAKPARPAAKSKHAAARAPKRSGKRSSR